MTELDSRVEKLPNRNDGHKILRPVDGLARDTES